MNIFQMSLQIPLSFAIHLKVADAARLLGPRCLARCLRERDGGSFGVAVWGGSPSPDQGDAPRSCPVQCGVRNPASEVPGGDWPPWDWGRGVCLHPGVLGES